jgi:hypothetical protein
VPDFRQSGEKPLRPHDNQGLGIKLESKTLENDPWAQNMLKEIGRTMTPGSDYQYMGSIALHWYVTQTHVVLVPGEGAQPRHTMATKQQFCVSGLSQAAVNTGVGQLLVELKKHYGGKHSTRDTNDLRALESTNPELR